MTTIISPEEMSNEKMQELFKAAYMKPKLDDNGYVRIKGPSGFYQIISVDGKKKLLKFMSIFGFKDNRSREEKLTLINNLNDGVVFARFSMPRGDVLLADYYIPYAEGVTPLQIMNCIQWFDKTTIGAIREYDRSDLVE